MRSTRNIVLALVALVPLVPVSQLHSQTIAVPTQRLQSPIDTVRMNAFYQLEGAADDHVHHPELPLTSFLAVRARQQPDLDAALIDLLTRENAVIAKAPLGTLNGDYLGGYYMTLKVTVARMQDPKSVDALLGGTGISGAVMNALIAFGDAAVPGVLNQLDNPDHHVRDVAVATLRYIVEGRVQNHLSASSVAAIVPALLTVARDPAAMNREDAIRGLVPLSNPEIRPVMLALESDSSPSLHIDGVADRHGVSDAAKEWLAKHPN